MSTTGLSQKSQDLKSKMARERKQSTNQLVKGIVGSKSNFPTDKDIEDFQAQLNSETIK